MSDTEDFINTVMTLAAQHNWPVEKIDVQKITFTIERQWKLYSVTMAWSSFDSTLRMMLSYETEPPSDRLPALYEMINYVNDQCWVGAFNFWTDRQLMLYRYGMPIIGQQITVDLVSQLVHIAVTAAERYYPAFQVVVWGKKSPAEALRVAIGEGHGHA